MSFQCAFCKGRIFKSRYAYEAHLLGKSVHKPLKCPVKGCPRAYNAMDMLVVVSYIYNCNLYQNSTDIVSHVALY